MRRTIRIKISPATPGDKLFAGALRAASSDPPDNPAAYDLLVKARALGSMEAVYALGNWFAHGIHVRKNRRKAHDLFVEAARANVPEALFNLGVSHENGWHGPKDSVAAYLCYLRAATLGDLDSIYEVFRCLQDGVGTTKDPAAARIWCDLYAGMGGDFEAKDAQR